MEAIGSIIGIFIVIAVVRALLSAGGQAVSNGVAQVKYGAFEIRLGEGIFRREDVSVPSIKISIKGVVPGHSAGVRLVFHLLDITGGTSAPVLCLNDSLQEKTTRFFEFAPSEIIPNGSAFTDWVELLEIPRLILIPPRKGRRTIACRVSVMAVDRASVFAGGVVAMGAAPIRESQTTTFVVHEGLGYLDHQESRVEFWSHAIRAAVLMAGVDGTIGSKEKSKISDWIARVKSELPSNSHDAARLDMVFREALESHASLDLDRTLATIRNTGGEFDHYEVIDLCTEVLAADGVIAPEERALLDLAIATLGLNAATARMALDRSIAKGSVSLGTSETEFADLGISAGMTSEEIRKVLTEEYRKWNARTTHDDPEIRERARQMTDRIAQARNAVLTK